MVYLPDFILIFAQLYAIVVIRYLVVSFFFDFYLNRFGWGFKKIEPHVRSSISKRGEILASMIASFWFALSGVLIFHWIQTGALKINFEISRQAIWQIPLGLLLYLVVQDVWFYFSHRLLHRAWFFKHIHHVHHRSLQTTSFAALSFHWLEGLFESTFLPIMIYFVPIHGFALVGFLMAMTFFGTINHAAYEYVSPAVHGSTWGRWILTPTHHLQHHERFNGNFALYFTWLDRSFGTQFDDYEARFSGVYSKV